MLRALASGVCVLAAAVVLAGLARASDAWRDAVDALDGWSVHTSEGVHATIQPDEGFAGKGVRLDFEFRRGSGYCLLRRALPAKLPDNYSFSFRMKADAPDNNLEFKLVDASGDNVWWVNRRNFEFPREWTEIVQRRRHFQFAWGPLGGKPMPEIGSFEVGVAAGSGGKGSIWLDEFEFRTLPVPAGDSGPIGLEYSSSTASVRELPADGRVGWRPAADDEAPWIAARFGASREFGGLSLAWAGSAPAEYWVEYSDDGQTWRGGLPVRGSDGGQDWIPLAGEGVALRVFWKRGAGDAAVVERLQAMPPPFGESANAMFAAITAAAPRGHWPRHMLGEQPYWTVIGVPEDEREALLDSDGALEIAKGACRVEPFLWVDGRLVTWADVERAARLAEGDLPLPSVVWRAPGLELEIAALADGEPGASTALVRYSLRNSGDKPLQARLALTLRPFQVLPPWQELNLVGGAGRIRELHWQGDRFVADREQVVRFWSAPSSAGVTAFERGEAVEHLARGAAPSDAECADQRGWCSGAAAFDLSVPAGEARSVVLEAPFYATKGELPAAPADPDGEFERRAAASAKYWRGELNRVQIELPPAGKKWADTLRSTLAYVLINADGPGIQPGSRTYERSWIRDGAMTSAALLQMGEVGRVRRFIEWYAPNQYDSGMVPCVVDRRGPDPVPEHDSTGELIYLLAEYYRYTGDREVLERCWPQVVKGVDYVEALRAKRMTSEYREGSPEQRAKYGLVTESISHEGYSAKAMHSYWDNLWLLRGLQDAADIAGVLGHDAERARFEKLLGEYRTAVNESIAQAQKNTGVDFIPGCAELGDFDACSTAIAYFPTGQAPFLNAASVDATFNKYWEWFQERRDGDKWREYTPYETRLIGTFVRRGEPERAQALADWFIAHHRPAEWNHWAEVVWREPATPRFIGDMPHTWVGSAFMSAFRSMFVYESGDGEVTIAAAPRPEWLTDGGLKVDLPTHFGRVAYALEASEAAGGDDAAASGGGLILTLTQVDPRVKRIVWATKTEKAGTVRDTAGWVRAGGVIVRPGAGASKIEP